MRSILAGLVAMTLTGCGPDSDRIEALPLAELVRFAERYDGQRVSTSGTVASHPDPEHYWIEDDALNRVEIRPADAIRGMVGDEVRVRGVFRYARDTGRIIRADEVAPIP